MLIELENALLDVEKRDDGKHVDVYVKNGIYEFAGNFFIEGGCSRSRIIKIYQENKEEFK